MTAISMPSAQRLPRQDILVPLSMSLDLEFADGCWDHAEGRSRRRPRQGAVV